MKLILVRRLTTILLIAVAALFCTGCGFMPRAGTEGAPPVRGETWTVPEIGITFVYVEPGSFKMGSEAERADNDEQPVHDVQIDTGFWMSKHEITEQQYRKLMGHNPASPTEADHPVGNVSWHDAMAFCSELTDQEWWAGRLPSDFTYRLPTEAEWAFAAHGGGRNSGHTYSGSNAIDEVAWYWRNCGDKRLSGEYSAYKLRKNNCGKRPVGQKKPNKLGIYDMSGNVWEWCLDRYAKDYYDDSPRVNPVNTGDAPCRVIRGGSWYFAASYCRSASRLRFPPDSSLKDLGFRIVLAPPNSASESGWFF